MNTKQKILAGLPVKKERAAKELPDVWVRGRVFVKCEPYLKTWTYNKIDYQTGEPKPVEESYQCDYQVTEIEPYYCYSFEEFAVAALLKHPDAYEIHMDWLGSRNSMAQGDLHLKTWEKIDGVWYDMPMETCNLEAFYNENYKKPSPILAHYLNF